MRVSIYDVGREGGVCMGRVWGVVNGNENVKGESKNKVKEVIKGLNYGGNGVGRGLGSKKRRRVGVMIGDICNIYY